MLVVPAVRVLDMVYATRITLEDLAGRYGDQPLEWPAHVVEQLKERNAAIHAAIETSICSMSAGLYYPLGERRAALRRGRVGWGKRGCLAPESRDYMSRVYT